MRRKRKLSLKIKIMCLLVFLLFFVIGGYFFIHRNKLQAATVVNAGAFKLNVENCWDGDDQKNYASLKWDAVSDLSHSGYQLYQSEDSVSWHLRSTNYGKEIKVLNIYPDIVDSRTLKEWMDSLNLKAPNGNQLIQVSSVSQNDFGLNPNKYLKNTAGSYQYDVIMFGSWDYNNHLDITVAAKNATQAYIDSGRGVLFGHDTITPNDKGHTNFNSFAGQLGFKLQASSFQLGSTTVKITNNGYLMKYPFELQNNLTLTIPLAHTWGQGILPNSNTIKWLEFQAPFNWNKPGDGTADATFYLATNNNLGMIQTGHSNGKSTIDERKIIANTLYNLAQVSSDTYAQDYTVKDNQPPKAPTAIQKTGGRVDKFDIEIDSTDVGKTYQWYIEANTRSNGIKKSDVVKETITSNIAGYFYKMDNSATSNLNTVVEGYKDEYGRISSERYNIYVAPKGTTNKADPSYDPAKDASLLTYNTKGTITGINGLTDFNKYLHVVSVDRANNVSGVKTIRIKDLMNTFRVTEQYLDTDGKKIQADTYKDIAKGKNYTERFKSIAGYVENSYSIDGNNGIESDFETVVSLVNINNHRTITYYYDKLIQLNLRQVILNPSEELVVPNSGYFQLDNVKLNQKSNLFHATVQSGREQENVPYTQLVIAKSGNHHQLAIMPTIPEYYSYSGYVATISDSLHNSNVKIKSDIVLDIKDKTSYWVTIYLEPALAAGDTPVPYSWEYQKNDLGEIVRKIPN
jgi:hypothetical protein